MAEIPSALWGQWEGQMQDEDGRKWLAVLNVDQSCPHMGRILMAEDARLEIWQHAVLTDIKGSLHKLQARIDFSDYPFDSRVTKKNTRRLPVLFQGVPRADLSTTS
jgi:hypothetical protein